MTIHAMRMIWLVLLTLGITPVLAAQPGGLLPQLDGEIALDGVQHPVTITRDGQGLPLITAQSLDEATFALGFIHGQDRFVQMDGARRMAAGRMAELVGTSMLDQDRHYRRFGLQRVAEEIFEQLSPRERQFLTQYAAGVNAALMHTPTRPEYTALGATPQPWVETDSILVLMMMYSMLHYNTVLEYPLGLMTEALPADLVTFLTPTNTRFEAPLLPEVGVNDQYHPAPIPGPEVIDLRTHSRAGRIEGLYAAPPMALGSNNWALAGARTAHGRAILASDPHLPLSTPGVWYRASIAFDGRTASGVTMPGMPGIVIGSNESVAWGFTNTSGDFMDYILVEVNPDNEAQYRTPDGWMNFEMVRETINVRRSEPQDHYVQTTIWGPVVRWDWHDRPLVLKWTALHPEATNLRIFDLMSATSLEEAIDIAASWNGPSQNIIIAARDGRIGWTVSGWFPNRVGYGGTIPVSWADGSCGWDGALPESKRPIIIDPESGMLFTANNRTVEEAWADELGNTYDIGARAQRIATMLNDHDAIDERAMLAMQLDTRVAMLDFYRDLAVESLQRQESDDAATAAILDALQSWNGRADVDQRAVRLLTTYRFRMHDAVVSPLVAACRELEPTFSYMWFRAEEPVRRILEVRPDHLLPPGYANWEALIDEVLHRSISTVAYSHADHPLQPWGETNVANIQNSVAMAVPAMASSLNMPPDPLPGHMYAVRVAWNQFGASIFSA
jgi:penicillin amidase